MWSYSDMYIEEHRQAICGTMNLWWVQKANEKYSLPTASIYIARYV